MMIQIEETYFEGDRQYAISKDGAEIVRIVLSTECEWFVMRNGVSIDSAPCSTNLHKVLGKVAALCLNGSLR